MDAEDMAAALKKAGYKVTPPPPKRKPDRCSVCGAVDQDVLYYADNFDLSEFDGVDMDTVELAEWLTRIRVEVGNIGNEGWDFKELLFCDQHDQEPLDGVIKLGFKTHHHGSTHPLEDPDCHYGCDQQSSPYDEEDG